ncbi:glycosyltransferase family 61 protein [Roseovarius sp. SYSU LYC5161]|uniref:glycosyltransferase family 61 protein n=1 Tax=Roseovarius halophilus (ex Wu et al. 2025) TaxID=3376060 RepID=UPI00399B38DB
MAVLGPRFYPLQALIRRLGRSDTSLTQAADSVEELSPESEETPPRVIALPGQPDRARASSGAAPLRDELALLFSRRSVHAPVIRYSFNDCLVRPDGVDSPRMRHAVGARLGIAPVNGPIDRAETGHFCMTHVSRAYFGHWLQDACATALLAPRGAPVFMDALSGTTHGPAYLDAFGITPRQTAACHVGRLHLYQDYAQGPSKRERYAGMRASLARAFPGDGTGAEGLYIRRGQSGQSRLIDGEEALIERLTRAGFEVLDITKADLATIQRRCRDARIAVSIEGSHLSHLQFAMPEGACIIALMPSDRVSALQAGYAHAAGLRFGVLMADPGPEGYRVDADELMATIDKADAAI